MDENEGTPSAFRVNAPSRLHFGLLSFGKREGRQFGGAGMMLSAPECCLEVRPSASFTTRGDDADRVAEFANVWRQKQDRATLPNCEIALVASLPPHVGLGSGTQLALATALALNHFCQLPKACPSELANGVGRGLRSAVGTYGFCAGGFIAEPGKADGETLAPLEKRVAVPEAWRILLIRSKSTSGVSGEAEKTAFSQLPPVSKATNQLLGYEMREVMIPALEAANCKDFGESVYRYGRLAGECFASCQGGPFATSQLGAIVEYVRSLGVAGVGQSSWGPTLFAVLPDLNNAEKLKRQLCERFEDEFECSISRPNNFGAVVSEIVES